MSYESEVLACQPVAYFPLPSSPGAREVPWPIGQKVTYEFGSPHTDATDSAVVVVDLDTGQPVSAYVNGQPVSTDHRYATEFMSRWTPPRRWERVADADTRATYGNSGAAAIYDKALTAEQIAAHYTAFQGD